MRAQDLLNRLTVEDKIMAAQWVAHLQVVRLCFRVHARTLLASSVCALLVIPSLVEPPYAHSGCR